MDSNHPVVQLPDFSHLSQGIRALPKARTSFTGSASSVKKAAGMACGDSPLGLEIAAELLCVQPVSKISGTGPYNAVLEGGIPLHEA